MSGLATHLLNVQREGKPMTQTATQKHEQELSELATRRRDRIQEIVTRWWTLIEEEKY